MRKFRHPFKPAPVPVWQPPLTRERRACIQSASTFSGIGLSLIGLSAILDFIVQPAPRIAWNASASAPIGFWHIRPGLPVHTGDMVLAHTPTSVRQLAAERHYLPANVPLLKRVVASSGDTVCAVGSRIFIDGRAFAKRRTADPQGRPLPWWNGCELLRNGRLFLMMDAPDSFDGRYFGPVDEAAVIGKATPLWLR